MKHLNYLLVTLAVILASTISTSAQSDAELLKIFVNSFENGIKSEMSNLKWEGIMTEANCEYNGQDIVITIEYTYNLQNSTQEEIDLIKNGITEKNLKIVQAQTMSSVLDSNADVKKFIINLLKNNDCDLVYNIYYNFPSETKHVTITLTAEDFEGKTVSKQDFVDMYVSSYRTALKSEIGKNGIVDANAEYDGTNIIIKTVLDIEKDFLENIPAENFKNYFIETMKQSATSLAEMTQLKLNDIDLILIYTGDNGGEKKVFIDTAEF